MNPTFRRLGPSELLPRYIFAESLFARRRVLEVGAVASTLGASAEFLVTRGARSVLALDDDLAAVEDAQKRLGSAALRFRASVYEDLPPGAFDVAFVADLGAYVLAPELLARLARLLAPGGCLVGGLRNPAGLALSQLMDPEGTDAPPTYGQLLDALSAHFPSVEVATQSPLLGYQLAFEKGEGLQVDGSLAGSSEAAYFVVLAGHEPVRQVDPTWVQLPPAPLAFTSGRLDEYSQRTRAWEERSGRLKDLLGQVRTQLEEKTSEGLGLQSELERARTEWQRVVAQLETREGSPSQSRERDELATRLRRLESELQVARERAEDAERRAEKHRAEAADAARVRKEGEALVLAANEEKRLERVRRDEVAALLEDTRGRLATAYEELRAAQDEVNGARAARERGKLAEERTHDEVQGLEQRLQEARARELRLAEQQSVALAAVENLQGALAEARRKVEAHDDEVLRKDAEIARLARVAEADAAALAEAQAQLAAERAQHSRAGSETGERLHALTTELAAAQSAASALSDEVRRLTRSEQHHQSLAVELEQKLGLMRQASEDAGDAAAGLQLQLDLAAGRIQKLEREAALAVGSAKEQLEARVQEAQERVRALSDERDALLGEKLELQSALHQSAEAFNAETQAHHALKLSLAEERAGWEVERGGHLEEQAALRAELSAHATEVTRLDQALAAARAQVAELEAKLSEQEAQAEHAGRAHLQVEALESQVSSLRAELEAERVQATALLAARAELERALAASRTELGRFEAQATAAEARLEELQARLAEASAASEAHQARAAASAQAHEALEAQLAVELVTTGSLREQLRLSDEARAKLEGAAAELQDSLRTLEQERTGVKALEASLEARVQRAEQALAEATEKASQSEAARAQAATELETLRAELDAARQHGASLERELQESRLASEEKAGLHEALESARAARTEVEASLIASANRVEGLEAELRKLTASEAATRRELEGVQGDLKNASGQLAAIRVIREQLQRELEGERQKARSLGAAVAELEASSEFSRKSLEEKSAQVAELEARMGAELPALQAELTQLREAASRVAQEGDARVVELREELARVKATAADISQLRAELTQLQASKATLEAELSAAQTFRHEAEDRTASTQTALRALQAELPPLKAQVEKLTQERVRALEEVGRLKGEIAKGDSERLGLLALSEGTQGHVDELERNIETLTADLAARQSASGVAKQREMELTTKLTEREAKLDVIQRRLSAQETELAALRRAAGRAPAGPNQVKEIYERASAELTAAKAELGKRPASPARTTSSDSLPSLPPPKPTVAAAPKPGLPPVLKPDKKG